MTRFLLFLLTVAAGLLPATFALAQEFDDVPADHWAYEAIDYLQDAGLVEGYPDGTFKGNRAFTRYEMAMVIARVFTKMQDFQAALESGGLAGQPQPSATDLTEVYSRLDRLSEEFRDELAELGVRVTAVEEEQELMRNEMDDLKALIKDSGLSGEVRFRSGGYINTGSEDITNEYGFESYLKLDYKFQPEENLDFNFSVTMAEIDGPAGTSFIPGANNETEETYPATPPFGNSAKAASFVVDEAYFKYHVCDYPQLLGDCPVITGGRQYFSQGEFGLAGDNGYRSNFGLRFDTSYGANFDAYAQYYRTESIAKLAPFDNADSLSFQSSGLTAEGDDFLMAGLEYHSGEATVPGHDYKSVLRIDVAPNAYGAEQYMSLSGNAEIPWFDGKFLNGIRGEWVLVSNNVSNQAPDGDLGIENSSFIVEVDLYNSGRTRFSFAAAQIAQIEGLPVYANVDNDPFSEWDFTINPTADAFNMSRENTLNYFPSDFSGFGLQAEHHFGDALHGILTYYQGERVNSNATDRPGMLRINLRYPVSSNSTMGFDYIMAGERSGLEDPISLVRGEYKIRF